MAWQNRKFDGTSRFSSKDKKNQDVFLYNFQSWLSTQGFTDIDFDEINRTDVYCDTDFWLTAKKGEQYWKFFIEYKRRAKHYGEWAKKGYYLDLKKIVGLKREACRDWLHQVCCVMAWQMDDALVIYTFAKDFNFRQSFGELQPMIPHVYSKAQQRHTKNNGRGLGYYIPLSKCKIINVNAKAA